MEEKQPKIVQRLLLRTFFLLLAVAAVFVAIQFVLTWRKDPDIGSSDTSGMIAALQIHDEGQQAVLFDASGKKIGSPEYEPNKTDRDIVWRPDGNRLFFTSDRKEGAFHLFRWNIGRGAVDQRSTGTLSKFDPSFAVVSDPSDKAEVEAAGNHVLLTQGGVVLSFDIRETSSQQILPPPGGVTVGAEEGSGGSGQFDMLYKRYGNAFRSARWAGGGNHIAAIMKRDEGEVLIIQQLGAESPEDALPHAILGGDRLDIDVDPKTGMVLVTVLNFQFPDLENIPPESIKNGKIVKPFVNGVFILDPTKRGAGSITPIAISNESKMAFGTAVVSPDGSQIAVPTGAYDGNSFIPAGLAVMPMQNGGMQAGSPVVAGQIYEVSWSPDGQTLVYIKRDGEERAIFKINKDGSSETKVSSGGDFMTPKFSPQTK